MPNIEIHGLGLPTAFLDLEVFESQEVDPGETEEAIFKIFADKPYRSEMVVSIIPSSVSDGKTSQPFLRVVSTPSPYLDEIVELLKTLDMDIEVQELKAFHPKEQ